MTANANGNANLAERKDTRKAPSKAALAYAELEAYLEDANRTIAAQAKAAPAKGTGTYLDYATKKPSPAIIAYMVWLNREFPTQFPSATDETQTKIVDLAIKCYTRFQQSDISYKKQKAAKAAS